MSDITIHKVQLDAAQDRSYDWDLSRLVDITPKQIINVQVIDGALYLFYWTKN